MRDALDLPMFKAANMTLLMGMTMIVKNEKIAHLLHLVTDPALSAQDVLTILRAHT